MYKYKNLCETNDPYHFKEKIDEKFLDLNEITKKIALNEDIIGREDKFIKIAIDKTYPEYILKNLKELENWID